MPRINLTPPEEVYAAIVKLSELEGLPLATVVNNYLLAILPGLNNIIEGLEAVRDKKDVKEYLNRAAVGVLKAAGELASEMEKEDLRNKENDDNLELAL